MMHLSWRAKGGLGFPLRLLRSHRLRNAAIRNRRPKLRFSVISETPVRNYFKSPKSAPKKGQALAQRRLAPQRDLRLAESVPPALPGSAAKQLLPFLCGRLRFHCCCSDGRSCCPWSRVAEASLECRGAAARWYTYSAPLFSLRVRTKRLQGRSPGTNRYAEVLTLKVVCYNSKVSEF